MARPVSRRNAAGDAVGFLEMPHRIGIAAEIVKGFAKSVVKGGKVCRGEAGIVEQRLHRIDQRAIGIGHLLCRCDAEIGLGQLRRNCDRASVAGDGLAEAALLVQRIPEQAVRLADLGIERYRLEQVTLGLGNLVRAQQHIGDPQAGAGAVRHRRGGAAQRRKGFLPVTVGEQQPGEAGRGLDMSGRRSNRSPVGVGRFGKPAEALQGRRQIAVEGGELGPVSECARKRLAAASAGRPRASSASPRLLCATASAVSRRIARREIDFASPTAPLASSSVANSSSATTDLRSSAAARRNSSMPSSVRPVLPAIVPSSSTAGKLGDATSSRRTSSSAVS